MTHDEFSSFDQRIFKAVNGDDGGTWAPSEVITIGGAGVSILITGPSSSLANGATLTSHGSFVFANDSATNFNGPVGYNGATTFGGFANTAFWGGSTTNFFVSSTLQLDGNVNSSTGVFLFGYSTSFTMNGAFYLGGSGTFAGIEVVFGCLDTRFNGGPVVFQGASVTFTCPTHLAGHTLLENDLAITGAGGIAYRVVSGATVNAKYSVSDVDEVVAPSTITTSIVYTIDNVGAVQGKRMRFSFFGAGHDGAIGIESSSDSLFLLGASGRGGFYCEWCEIVFLSGSWRQSASGRAVPGF